MNKRTPKDSNALFAEHRCQFEKDFIEQDDFDGFSDHDILEMILSFSVPGSECTELSRRLLDSFGSLDRVLEAEHERLLAVNGVSEGTACFLRMFLPAFSRYTQNRIRKKRCFDNDNELIQYLHSFYAGQGCERVLLLSFDRDGTLLSTDIIGEGDAGSSGFSLRRIIEIVTQTGADSVLLSHNHPHSIARPSDEDITATEQLIKALQNMGVTLRDHIILSGKDHCFCSDHM